MASIVTKVIKGKKYFYLVRSIRKGDKVRQETLRYLGRARPLTKEEKTCIIRSHQEEDWIIKAFRDELSYQDHTVMKKHSNHLQAARKHLDPVSKEKERERFLSTLIATSNSIEGSTLTADETFQYLFNDLSPKGKNRKELHMAQNLLHAWEYVEQHHKKLPTNQNLKALHALVNKNIETPETLGEYKKVQNYAGRALTTSPFFVEERMKRLHNWIQNAYKHINAFEIAFQSHAQFEVIHPFIDGNGRVGRLLLNWLLLQQGLEPLIVRNTQRLAYIEALENARRGSLEPLCKLFFQEYTKN